MAENNYTKKLEDVLKIGIEERLINHIQGGGTHPLDYVALLASMEEFEICAVNSDKEIIAELPVAIRSVMVLGTIKMLEELGFNICKNLYDLEGVVEEELDAVLSCHDRSDVVTH